MPIRRTTKKEPHQLKSRGSFLYSFYTIRIYIPIYLILYLLHQIQTIQPIRKLTYLYRLNKNNDPNMIGAPI